MSLVRTRTSSSDAFETTALAPAGSQPRSVKETPEELRRWVGVELDHFTVERPLGQGGMGAVFLGRDRSLDRQVAIKVLPHALAGKTGQEERFIREARAQARLNSPHVVHIYYIGHASVPGVPDTQTLFFAMEWVDGDSLEGMESAPEEARQLMLQAARGLRDALAAGIVHRDVKPSNLLRDKRGYLKIADFGLAKPLDGGDPRITQDGVVMGSPLYMSPEQARSEEVDHRADMYSLGCAFHHVLAGAPPYDAPSPLAVIAKHLSSPVPELKTLRPDVPPAFAAVIERLMAKKPEERFAGYDDLIAALEACAPKATNYAGFWTRGAAALIDGILALVLVYALGFAGVAIDIVYFTLAHAYLGRTAGKYLLSIEVVRPDGARLGLARAALRTLVGYWLPFLLAAEAVATGGIAPLKAFIEHLDAGELDQMKMVIATLAASHVLLSAVYAGGFVLAAFHRQKRAAHDLAAGSVVVYRLKREGAVKTSASP